MRKISFFILFLFACTNCFAQTIDSVIPESVSAVDSYHVVIDTSFLLHNDSLSNLRSSFSELPNAWRSDIQLVHYRQKPVWIFIWILFSLVMFTVLRNLFKHELGLLLLSFTNKRLAAHSSRSSTSSVTVFSLFLLVMFVVNCSVLTVFTLRYFFPEKYIDTTQFLFLLIFLFTFFIIVKTVAARVLGAVFDLHETAEVYIDDLYVSIKMLAIATFPQVMLIYVADEKIRLFLISIFIISIFIMGASLLWRGLSTSIELMYKSVYHFFIYICIAEILVVFLFIKLLTQNAF